MKFAPRKSQIIGRLVIRRPRDSVIIRVNETKATRFFLVDGVGEEAAAEGIRPGDVILAKMHNNIIIEGAFRPLCEEKDVAGFVTKLDRESFFIQTDNGEQYVAFDSLMAALSWADDLPVREEVKAAE